VLTGYLNALIQLRTPIAERRSQAISTATQAACLTFGFLDQLLFQAGRIYKEIRTHLDIMLCEIHTAATGKYRVDHYGRVDVNRIEGSEVVHSVHMAKDSCLRMIVNRVQIW
jgi:hypothetical protein